MIHPANSENETAFNALKYSLIFIIVAYTFSITMRLIWIVQFQDTQSFYWNNELMINTNDGYFFASAVQHLLEGIHDHNPQIPIALASYPGVVYATYLAAKLLPFSLETIILYMPAVISSLVVIPIILITRLFNMQLLGFFAALLGSIGLSYYNRTMAGYYDSDMFAVLMQMFVLYGFISLLIRHRTVNVSLLFFAISVYPYFYPQGLSLIYAMFGIYAVYAAYLYRNDAITYFSIAMIALALTPFPFLIKALLFFGIYLFPYIKITNMRLWWAFAALASLIFLFEANVFGLILEKIRGYTQRGTETSGLQFFQVIQTVREAGQIPFSVMAERISGSTLGVIVALAGYIVLVIRHRPFILALPLIAIGVFSLVGGLRFTVFAVAIAAISAVYFFFFATKIIINDKTRITIVAALTALMLYPNITHIIDYKVPTVFTKEEVGVLDRLKSQGSSKDYVVTWWDFGYPIWFYANKNTLIDGGKHDHDNFIVSQILNTTSPLQAAQLSRIAVETYIQSDYQIIADTLFKNHQDDQLHVATYLENLASTRVALPEKSAEIYLYLPFRMMNIFPTVTIFSNLDLNTGAQKERPFFYATAQFKDDGNILHLGNGIALDKAKGVIQLGPQDAPLNTFYSTSYQNNGTLHVQTQPISMQGKLSLIYMKNYNQFLLLDNAMLQSMYIQMFVFEQYDKELFEAVELSPHAKVYRVKI